MFGYLEYDGNNFNKDMEEMQKIPIVDKWTKLMIDCFNPFPNNEDNNSWVMMDEIFHLEIKFMSKIKKIEVFFFDRISFSKN